MTIKIKAFESHAIDYDKWFDRYPEVFSSEVEALRDALPAGDIRGIEVGAGTGRFAQALGIKQGVEPAAAMREIALNRGIDVFDATAERLPFKDMKYDFILINTCISYFNKLGPAFSEANRVLKPGGSLIVGFIDKNSHIGKFYESKRQDSLFYKEAIFYTPQRVELEIKNAGFRNLEFTQTLFKNLDDIKEFEPAEKGFGKGSFVVIKAIKK